MMHPPEEQLSEYVDGGLTPAEATALEAHLAQCPACGALAQELRRVMQRAQALEDRAPRQDLWPGVAAAIGAGPAGRRRFSFSLPQLLAASVALTLVSGGTAIWLSRGASAARELAEVPTMSAAPIPAGSRAAAGYALALGQLERELERNRGRLDSTTQRVVEEKLAIIDRAILEAEQALATDSSDSYLHSHLAQTRLRKLELLRQAAALTRQVS